MTKPKALQVKTLDHEVSAAINTVMDCERFISIADQLLVRFLDGIETQKKDLLLARGAILNHDEDQDLRFPLEQLRPKIKMLKEQLYSIQEKLP